MTPLPRESTLPEKREPTHTLTISVPLNLDEDAGAYSWTIQEAFREAVSWIVPVTRLGTLGVLCGDITVDVAESGQEERNPDE